jgi:putative transposase
MRDEIQSDEGVVMLNYFHGILIINCRGTARRAPTLEQFGKPVSGLVPTIIWVFKSAAAKRINELRQTSGVKWWQRNFWEHVIRTESELNEIRQYIQHNPAQWEVDRLYSSGRDEKIFAPTIRESQWEYMA